MRSQDLLHGERGTSIVEFLIIGPLVCLLFYAAVDLNERLDQKRTLRIASRNVAAAGIEGAEPVKGAQKILTEALVGQGHTAFQDAATKDALVRSSAQNGVAQGGNRLAADIGDFEYGGQKGDQMMPDARLDAKDEHDDGLYKTISGGEAMLSRGGRIMDGIFNFKILGEGLFLGDSPRVATVRMTTENQSSIFKRGIGLLDRSIQRKNPDAATFKNLETDLVSRSYVRVESGRHPNAYRQQGLAGFAVGMLNSDAKHWGDKYKRESGDFMGGLFRFSGPDPGFPRECMMNFTAGDECTDTNWYSVIIIVVAEVRGIISLIHGGESGGKGFNGNSKFAGEMDDENPKDAGALAGGFGSGVGNILQGQLSGQSGGMQDLLGGDPTKIVKDQVMDQVGLSTSGSPVVTQLQNTMGQETGP